MTQKFIMQSALEMSQSDKFKSFNASRGWCEGFLKRYGLSLRRKTHQSQKLPSDLVPKLISFFAFLRKYFETYSIPAKDIIAADETSVQFDCTGNSTIEIQGVKTVSLASTGHDKLCVTVMLAASASGIKKRPTIVFKGWSFKLQLLMKGTKPYKCEYCEKNVFLN